VILRFPYMPESLPGPPPPSLPKAARERWRPVVPITVHGPLGATLALSHALVDSGADDSIFPLDVATVLAIQFLPGSGHAMRWRGQAHALRFGSVELELRDSHGNSLRWPAILAFTTAKVHYPLLGIWGFLEFLEAKFRGAARILELEADASFPGRP
jgi:hypothetical protein